MTLAINIATPEGIVVATDSRQSYRNAKNVYRIGSDSAEKLFRFNSRTAIAIAGPAFLATDGLPKSLGKYVDEYRRSVNADALTVRETADGLSSYIASKLNLSKQLQALATSVRQDLEAKGWTQVDVALDRTRSVVTFRGRQNGRSSNGTVAIEPIVLMIAGFDGDHHFVFNAHVPGDIQLLRDSADPSLAYGANWIGQSDVIRRIILGFDPRIASIPFVREASAKLSEKELNQQLGSLEYIINWGTMTLHDAVEFSALAIHTTAAVKRFSDGIACDPGDIAGVGGPVDVAVITPDEGFKWIRRKVVVPSEEVAPIQINAA